MRFREIFAVVAGIAVLLPATLYPQGPPADIPALKASTELVLVPAVVTDKSGAHVAGLRKEDFVLKQDGKDKPIAVFEEVKTDTARLHRSTGPTGTYSNVDASGSAHHRLSIIVLDFVNTPFPDQANARAALLKFLSQIADSGEPMCLLALTRNGLVLIHDFTDDPKDLAAALRQAESNTAPLINQPQVEAGQFPGGGGLGFLTRIVRAQLEGEARMAAAESKVAAAVTVEALQQIAKAFRGLPGRKSLIWASSGFPFSASALDDLSPGAPGAPSHDVYDNLWKLMNDAQIAIYSVDLRSVTSGVQSPGGVRPSDVGDVQFDTEMQEKEKMVETSSTLELFADNTGGKAFLGGGNLAESFRQAVQDDSSYYMLGYYVSQRDTKPGWHPLSVGVHSKGSRLRYRKGFLLSHDSTAPSARQEIRLALNSPLDFTGLPLAVSWTGTEPARTAGKTRVAFDLVMPPGFAAIDESDENHLVVDIAVVARNAAGDVAADSSQRIDVHLKGANLDQIQHNGMTYRNGLQLPSGNYLVRFVVRDSLGNRTGSVAAPVTVKP